jgi:hypothetical protein
MNYVDRENLITEICQDGTQLKIFEKAKEFANHLNGRGEYNNVYSRLVNDISDMLIDSFIFGVEYKSLKQEN